MISIRSIIASEWPRYRDMRLRALLDSPDAFGSTYAEEATRADEAWAARIAAAVDSRLDRVFLALNGEEACGLVWCKVRVPGEAQLFQMWVDPATRGQGAGRRLLEAAIGWAQQVDARCVRLGVTVQDSPALRLYTALGFRPAGPLEPLREGSRLQSQPMALSLSR